MSMTFIYRSPTTPAGPGFVVDLGNQFARLGSISGFIMEAELGSVGISSLAGDDPTGTAGHDSDAIVGLKQFTVNELAAPNNNRRIFEGYIGDRRYYRGTSSQSPSLITGAARIIDMTLVDINSFLSFRIFPPSGVNLDDDTFNRPAETDVARVTALLSVGFLSTTLFDNGNVSTSNPTDMDAVDYTGQRPADVLNDCAQQSGKNFFVYYDEVANQFSLFYDFNSSTAYPAYDTSLKISNVLADCNFTSQAPTGPIWPANVDAVLTRDPSRVVAGVLIQNGSNSVYVNQLTTSYTYGYRDAVGDSQNLKTVTQATTRAQRYLSENSTEDDRLTFTVRFPAANVNDWKEGQWAPVKFSHLPGYEDYVNVRCLTRTVSQDMETSDWYNVKYECTTAATSVVTGLHQLVLTGRYGGTLHTSGTYDCIWAGSNVGGITVVTPAVTQDTDGYTGTAGDMQWGVASLTSWTIPTGLGGHYDVGANMFAYNNAWWITTSIPSEPNPQQIAYPGYNTDNGCGASVSNAGATVTWRLFNVTTGLTLATWVSQSAPGGYWIPLAHLPRTSVSVADGDVLKCTIQLSSGVHPENGAMGAVYGGTVYGGQQGVFWMTRTGP